MRVLQVYRTYFPDTQGGLEEVIRQICLNSKQYGVESKVYTLAENPIPAVIDREEAEVIRVKKHFEVSSCSISFTGFKQFRELVEWADVIHFHFPWPFGDLLRLMNRIDKPTLVTYHSDIVRQKFLMHLYTPLMTNFLKSVGTIVCTSPNYFATSNVLTKYAEKVEVIPIGINPDSYPDVSENLLHNIKAEFGEGFFLFVGVLRYYKGLHILLDAIKSAPYKVVIVGCGPIEKELKEQAKRLKLTNVIFAGYVSDETKVALFKLSRCVVFPSYLRSEAFGVTLLEGAMYSKPLISAEVGSGTSHVNIHGETGMVVTPGSHKSLREAMDHIYRNPEKAALLGNNARRRFEALFTGEIMGEQYANLYNQLVSKCIPWQNSILQNPVTDRGMI